MVIVKDCGRRLQSLWFGERLDRRQGGVQILKSVYLSMKYFGQKGGSDGSRGGGGGDTNPNMFISVIPTFSPEFNIQSVSSVNLSMVHLHLH